MSGTLGGRLVFRSGKNGQTIVGVKRRSDPDHEFNPSQLASQEAFRQGAAYAKVARVENVYVTKAEGTTKSDYNVAMGDWFNKPQIPEIDVTLWNGQAGRPIRVKATDDVQAARVSVVVTDANGSRLRITAQDRPGNTAHASWQN